MRKGYICFLAFYSSFYYHIFIFGLMGHLIFSKNKREPKITFLNASIEYTTRISDPKKKYMKKKAICVWTMGLNHTTYYINK